ncbi:hypothetical protein M422DRAFT_180561, partial [Sphaerobolus stellatus SS14]
FENWQEYQHILRYNPKFYDKPRYDCVVINTDHVSFAYIYALQAGSWKPKVVWDNCRISEKKSFNFVSINYLIQGCHTLPVFEKSGKIYYMSDLADGDAFCDFPWMTGYHRPQCNGININI